MRSMKDVNDIGVRALVDALGKNDARRFLAQFRTEASATAEGDAPHEELPSLTIDEAHQAIRDMHDPMEQQHML